MKIVRILGLLMATAMATALAGVGHAAELFQEGVHYERLPVPVETQDPARIEVVEVFSYACIHCRNFDPAVEAWRKKQPDDVLFTRVPAVFNDTWATLAQAFYTAEVLGVSDAVHQPMFAAIHDRGVDLRNVALLAALFETSAGVAPDQFATVFQSFSIRSRVQQAKARGQTYRLTGVPTLIVDGRFKIDGRMAGGNDRMLQVVDFLVARQRDGRHDAARSEAADADAE